jgi:Acyl-CoA carboxylase epsilon subunit
VSDEEATSDGAASGPQGSDVRVIAGNPSEEEIAAVTAVLAALAEQRAATVAEEAVIPPPSAWERSRRGVRRPIEVGRGRWRQFSG